MGTSLVYLPAAGLAALRWISAGHGYDITDTEIHEAYQVVLLASSSTGADDQHIRNKVRQQLDIYPASRQYMYKVLARDLGPL